MYTSNFIHVRFVVAVVTVFLIYKMLCYLADSKQTLTHTLEDMNELNCDDIQHNRPNSTHNNIKTVAGIKIKGENKKPITKRISFTSSKQFYLVAVMPCLTSNEFGFVVVLLLLIHIKHDEFVVILTFYTNAFSFNIRFMWKFVI